MFFLFQVCLSELFKQYRTMIYVLHSPSFYPPCAHRQNKICEVHKLWSLPMWNSFDYYSFSFLFYFRYTSQVFLSWQSAFTRSLKKVSGHAVHLKVLKYGPTLFNPLNPELNPICYLLALLAHHFLHISRIRVNVAPLSSDTLLLASCPLLKASL